MKRNIAGGEMNSREVIKCDVAVVGAGPAGMMAAGTAAENGAQVLLVEKNRRPGRKLLITGKGRCNITNADFNTRSFIENFGSKGRYLHSIFNAFGVQDVMDFFTERGLCLKVERGNRVFPESDRALDVLRVLEEYIRESGVRVMTGCQVLEIKKSGPRITGIVTGEGLIEAEDYILCTGGLSYPETGSTGDGFDFARALGHAVVEPAPSLVPVVLRDEFVRELEGLSLRNVSISLLCAGRTAAREFGEALFTHNGMSGPVILDLSRKIGELLQERLFLEIDLKPALDEKTLDLRIQRDFAESSGRIFKNSLSGLMPSSLIPVAVRLSGIDPQKKVSQITRDERKGLVKLLKGIRAEVSGLEGFSRAIITAGGIDLDEIDMRTMRSRIIENLLFAGEVIDIDGPTGGFNLQVCWSTGRCAGMSACGNP